MDEEIKDELEKIYMFPIEVEFIDFRQYKITGLVDMQNFSVIIIYDSTATLNANINNIVYKIDNEIIKLFKKARI